MAFLHVSTYGLGRNASPFSYILTLAAALRACLLQIWDFAKRDASKGPKGLTETQFTVALRLIALAQSGRELNERLMSQACSASSWAAANNPPLPAPRIDVPTDQIR